MILVFLLSNILAFVISKYDPDLQPGQKEIYGYLQDHDMKVSTKNVGDFSIITYNMERKDALNSDKQVEGLASLLDNTHAPILCLQDISKDEMDKLKIHILPHYDSVANDSKTIDPTSGHETYNPIVYDTKSLVHVKHGAFKNGGLSKDSAYASWGMFKNKKTDMVFTVINLNLYSAKSLTASIELASILKDVQSTPDVKKNIIFIAGTINSMSEDTKILIKKSFVKLSKNDDPTKPQNTLNTYLDVINNTERDVILAMNSANTQAQPVYSSILSKFTSGARFPIHVIFNILNT